MRRIALRSTVLIAMLCGLQACGNATLVPTGPANTAPMIAVNPQIMTLAIPPNRGELALAINLTKTSSSSGYHLLDASQLSAWSQNIDHITFSVTGANLSAPITTTVTKSQFINNQAVLQINNLPPGSVNIQAVAYDASGKQIVSASGTGTVTVNALSTVNLVSQPQNTGSGQIRVNIQLEQDCVCEEATPTPQAFVPNPVTIVNWGSTTDPHEEGGNGLKFDNMMNGTFLAIKTINGDFMLEKNQEPAPDGTWAGKPVNNAVGIKSNGDVFLYYLYGQRAVLNSQSVTLADGQTQGAPNGMTIQRQGNEYIVTSPQGDVTVIQDAGNCLNLGGRISANRVVHEVQGELGTFDNDTAQAAMIMRDGTTTTDLNAFLEDWAVRGDEDLFPYSVPFIPSSRAASPASGASIAPAAAATNPAPAAATPAATPSAAQALTQVATPTVTTPTQTASVSPASAAPAPVVATTAPSAAPVPAPAPTRAPLATPTPAPGFGIYRPVIR